MRGSCLLVIIISKSTICDCESYVSDFSLAAMVTTTHYESL